MFRIINRALLKAVTGLSGVVALSLLMMTTSSCERIGEGEISVALRQDEVSAAAGSIFMGVTASSDWTLTLEFADGAEPWASLNATSGSGSRNNVILSFEANSGEVSRSLDVVLISANQRASATFTQLAEGEQPTEDPDYPGLVSDAPRQWMELPAMTIESGCAWVFHNMTIDGKEVRNYSLYYDVENRLSHWVAYPLNAHLRGTGSRHDQFDAKDPKIPVTYQPYTERGWGVDGYDRGHQIPAADRYRSDAHRATFYPTNMTMQNSSLNQQMWQSLEDAVRDWSDNSDTLYVVTGCVPSEHFEYDKGGNRVNVPAGYYKALLRYSAASTISPYLGVAFYFENRAYGDRNYSACKMTIDALEEQLGMDFFPNIPDTYEAAAESSINSWWGLGN